MGLLVPVKFKLKMIGGTTEKMINFDLIPSLQIIDGQEKREKRDPPKFENATANC